MIFFVLFLNALLMIALPLVIGVILARRMHLDWGLFGAGAVTFLAAQVGHLPFNRWVLAPLLSRHGLMSGAGLSLLAGAILLGLSAGVFEEGARYLALRYWQRKVRSWSQALMFGLGHGGIEAIILGAASLYSVVQLFALSRVDLGGLLSPEQAQAAQGQLNAILAMPWTVGLLGAVERVAAIAFHLSTTLMVLRAVSSRKISWLAAAVGWHTLLDAIGVFGVKVWGVFLTEGLIVLCGVLSLWLVAYLRPVSAGAPFAEEGFQPPPLEPSEGGELTEETIEATRYADRK